MQIMKSNEQRMFLYVTIASLLCSSVLSGRYYLRMIAIMN